MRKFLLGLLCCLFLQTATAQKNKALPDFKKIENAILEDGQRLYQMEMATRLGVEIFTNDLYDLHAKTGGYFPYKDGKLFKCVFYNKLAEAEIVATISFDSTFNAQNEMVNTTLRPMNWLEKDLYKMNEHALDDIKRDTTFYKFYTNTTTSLLPFVDKNHRSIYVITKSLDPTVVIFGNDYQIDFDNAGYIASRRVLHDSLITMETSSKDPYADESMEAVTHRHSGGTGEYMTPTDVCTIMLNQKKSCWQHQVVIGPNYVSVWYCDVNEFQATTKKEWYKFNKSHDPDLEKDKPVAVGEKQ